jgi:hypothetical protein
MPIRDEMKKLYLPKKEWDELRAERLKAQGDKCLWCAAPNHVHVYRYNKKWYYDEPIDWMTGKPFPNRKVRIVLTIAHLDHDPRNNAPSNTPALCQACHNSHDAKHRARGRVEREDAKKISEYNNRMKGDLS